MGRTKCSIISLNINVDKHKGNRPHIPKKANALKMSLCASNISDNSHQNVEPLSSTPFIALLTRLSILLQKNFNKSKKVDKWFRVSIVQEHIIFINGIHTGEVKLSANGVGCVVT